MQKGEHAETGNIAPLLTKVGAALTQYLRFEHADAMQSHTQWHPVFNIPLPEKGVGIDATVNELCEQLIPNGSLVCKPGFTSFVTTGATTIATLTSLAATVTNPQRFGLTPCNFLEEQSLHWLATLCGLAEHMRGVYSSGGSVANLLAIGAARQHAFELRGHDPAADGVYGPVALYASAHTHQTIKRAAGVLGLGRNAVLGVDCDARGCMRPEALQKAIECDLQAGKIPIAVIANAGTTNAGSIDDLQSLGEIAAANNIWFHVDGAYGLPGILDERVAPLYAGLELADSAIVDPHKWLGAATGIAATFVRDRSILERAFTQEPAAYLDTAFDFDKAEHSLDNPGHRYSDYGVELSAPPRGITVWGLLREIGREGMRARICRHNDMARHVAERAKAHPNLELVMEPTLSICCFRYIDEAISDLNAHNTRIHRALIRAGENMPSTTLLDGKLVIRPCFIGARTEFVQADQLVDEVLRLGAEL